VAVNPEPGRGRLVAWLCFVALFATLQYAAYFSADTDERVPEDFLYRYSSAVFGVVQFGIMLGIALLIAVGLSKRQLFALRRPKSWWVASGVAFGTLVGIYVLSAALSVFIDPGAEQGLLPDKWDPDRAAQYAVNFVVVAGLVPVIEELLFRGLGFTLLQQHYGEGLAIVGTAVLFATAHGLVEAFPVIAAFGVGLGILRSRTTSVFPGIIVHSAFNSIAMLAVFAQ
jgi:uncharacterized protein